MQQRYRCLPFDLWRGRGIIFAVFILLSFSKSLLSQSDSTKVLIAGTIQDPLRKPVEGAEVRIVGTPITVLSSPAGTFRLWAPKASVTLFQLRRPGYRSQLLKTSGDWSGTVVMEPGAFELPEVQVTARYAKPAKYAATSKYDDYFRWRRQGLGNFIDREEVDRRFAFQTAEILQGHAGVKVRLQPPGMPDGTIVAFSRCSENPPKINVYVDGRKLMPDARLLDIRDQTFPAGGAHQQAAESPEMIELRLRARAMVGELLQRVNPGDIEFIALFRGPSELPPEFNDGNCGAIAIWTRSGGS